MDVLSEESLPAYLRTLELVAADEPLEVEPAGDGNINWVRRLRSPRTGRSWIVKQARSALERFPEYSASTERIVFEHRWLEIARPHDTSRICPEVVRFDEARRVLVLEDLGASERLDRALARGADALPALVALASFLGRLHAATAPRAIELEPRFRNDEMRRLHGDHIFHLPFRANDFPPSEELRAAAADVWADAELVAIADRAYARYLASPSPDRAAGRFALVHADVQAGNVLLAPRGPVLLDAEIAHVGDPAFDVGTLVAHVVLPAIGRGNVATAVPPVGALWDAYVSAGSDHAIGDEGVRFADVVRYAAIEILRRTIGAARVPVIESTDASLAALAIVTRLMRTPPASVRDLGAALAQAEPKGRLR